MEISTLKIGMFEMLAIVVLVVYLGQWLQNRFPVLKRYCIPPAVIGGTLVAVLTCVLYLGGVVSFEWENYTVMNNFFYNIFFAASGTAASLALLKKGGKLVVIFSVLAALLAVLQNTLALGVGTALGMNPLTALMAGSTPLSGGHGNAASFGPIAAEMGGVGAVEVAVAAATFGLISGCVIGGPIGRQLIQKHRLYQAGDTEGEPEEFGETAAGALRSEKSMSAWFLLLLSCGLGQLLFRLRQLALPDVNIPIHVTCMLGGILVRLALDKTGKGGQALYDTFDNIGDFCLAIFVSMSIVTMKLWQLIDLALPLLTILVLQLVLIYLFVRFLTFNLCGRNYDAAVIAVGHTGFGLGAVPVSMATMTSVCEQFRYSKLAFFVVPLIGGFISNLTNAVAITAFLNLAQRML